MTNPSSPSPSSTSSSPTTMLTHRPSTPPSSLVVTTAPSLLTRSSSGDRFLSAPRVRTPPQRTLSSSSYTSTTTTTMPTTSNYPRPSSRNTYSIVWIVLLVQVVIATLWKMNDFSSLAGMTTSTAPKTAEQQPGLRSTLVSTSLTSIPSQQMSSVPPPRQQQEQQQQQQRMMEREDADCQTATALSSSSLEEKAKGPSSVMQLNWLVPETGVPETTTCTDLMDHFYDLNHAFRGTGRWYGQGSSRNKPIVNYAWYQGQGFGRVVDHSALHCILGMLLNRPCVIDLEDRDPYHTWRSFIHTGTYDWEMPGPAEEEADAKNVVNTQTSSYHPFGNYTESIRKSFGALKQKGDDQWKGVSEKPNYPGIYLLDETPTDWLPVPDATTGKRSRKMSVDEFYTNIKPWRADQLDAYLLSPNWGTAWFPQLAIPHQIGQCSIHELRGLVQNALYKPTPLSMKIHKQRALAVLVPNRTSISTSTTTSYSSTSSSLTSIALAKEQLEQQIQELKDPTPLYGVIHIRTVILQRPYEEILSNLRECVHFLQDATHHRVPNWWILADRAETAAKLTQDVRQPDGSSILYHGYTQEEIDGGIPHSNLPQAKGLYGHEYMSKSILDWLTLHESQFAVITKGSYGLTGSRGRGKYQRTDEYKHKNNVDGSNDKKARRVDGGKCSSYFEILHGHDFDDILAVDNDNDGSGNDRGMGALTQTVV